MVYIYTLLVLDWFSNITVFFELTSVADSTPWSEACRLQGQRGGVWNYSSFIGVVAKLDSTTTCHVRGELALFVLKIFEF